MNKTYIGRFPESQIAGMDRHEYAKRRDEIMKDVKEGNITKSWIRSKFYYLLKVVKGK